MPLAFARRSTTLAHPMRFLCISDIHGNAFALERVLAAGSERQVNQVIACGDLLFPGERPLDCWHMLVKHNTLCVQGVGDRALAKLDPESLTAASEADGQRLERLRQTHAELGELIVAHLGKLDSIARLHLESGHEMIVVHGSPMDPTEPFTPDMSDEEMNALIGDDPADVIVCGGCHVPFERQIGDTLIVGVGSVGEPPDGGAAHATLLESDSMGVRVNQFAVDLGPDNE